MDAHIVSYMKVVEGGEICSCEERDKKPTNALRNRWLSRGSDARTLHSGVVQADALTPIHGSCCAPVSDKQSDNVHVQERYLQKKLKRGITDVHLLPTPTPIQYTDASRVPKGRKNVVVMSRLRMSLIFGPLMPGWC